MTENAAGCPSCGVEGVFCPTHGTVTATVADQPSPSAATERCVCFCHTAVGAITACKHCNPQSGAVIAAGPDPEILRLLYGEMDDYDEQTVRLMADSMSTGLWSSDLPNTYINHARHMLAIAKRREAERA